MTTSTTSSSTSSSTSTVTLYPQSLNILPQDEESAWIRSAHDERVEMFGLPCRIYRFKDLDPAARVYDKFDDPQITLAQLPTPIVSLVILEPYQEEYDRTGDTRGKEIENFPFTGTFKFEDGVQKQDLVEVMWEFAQQSGRTLRYAGSVRGPVEKLPTRFKLVNRRLTGIKSDLTNKFYMSPTEESWGS